MTGFTPLASLIGGMMIGLSVKALNPRITILT